MSKKIKHPFIIISPEINDENRIAVYRLSFGCDMFYIGSSVNLARRIIQYRYNLYNRHDINKKVKAALNSHSSAELSIIEVCSKENLKQREDFYIKQSIGNPNCLNRSKSAFVNQITEYSQEERYALGNSRRGKPMHENLRVKLLEAHLGKPKPDDVRRKISASNMGKKFTEEHKAKLKAARVGMKLSESHKQNLRGKTNIKVDKFDLSGNFVETYDSYSDAAKSIGAKAGHIGEVVNGKYKSRKGYVFKKHEEQKNNS